MAIAIYPARRETTLSQTSGSVDIFNIPTGYCRVVVLDSLKWMAPRSLGKRGGREKTFLSGYGTIPDEGARHVGLLVCFHCHWILSYSQLVDFLDTW